MKRYDVIVIGGGHAGVEAAWAAASALAGGGSDAGGSGADGAPCAGRERPRVVLITMDPSRIGAMSCNPAIGGLAKGQMVREIDALGGVMGLAADASGIMFKVLNQSKGAAVRGPRAQCDKYHYAAAVQGLLAGRPEIEVIAGTVDELLVEQGECVGVRLPAGWEVCAPNASALESNARGDAMAVPVFARGAGAGAGACAGASAPGNAAAEFRAQAVVLTTGTFMRALMHTGAQQTPGGRVGEGSAVGISGMLRTLGFELGRLKTGTPPRLAREGIAWDELEPQRGDDPPVPFSDMSAEPPEPRLSAPEIEGGISRYGFTTRFPALAQSECRLTRTTPDVHALIRQNLHLAPMYSGQIEAECGPRYCPSLEDKVVKFAERESHQVFLEPESLFTNEIYCNGISTSLPAEVQERIVHGMPGCERAQIVRWGYAVEYDMVWPHQIDATGETKRVRSLFLAGQINGTSGYEEAAAQGLIAGLNAGRRALQQDAVRLTRSQAYIGVMMDDLVTRTPREPYRMFTSRAEHRLLLRSDNSDERLTPLGREFGLVDDARWNAWEARRERIAELREALRTTRHLDGRLIDWARRPDVSASEIGELLHGAFPLTLVDRVITDLRYAGYVERQRAEVRRQEASEHISIPTALASAPVNITGLRREAQEALQKFQPATLGQAGRLAGISPADVTLIALAVRRHRGNATAGSR